MREVKCPICKDPAIVMRVGRDNLRCRCMDCCHSFLAAPTVPKKKQKRQKKKGPARRTFAGLRGTKNSKREWTFKYETDEYGPLSLKTTKNSWGGWSVWWANERIGSGNTIKEALNEAKISLSQKGYYLSEK